MGSGINRLKYFSLRPTISLLKSENNGKRFDGTSAVTCVTRYKTLDWVKFQLQSPLFNLVNNNVQKIKSILLPSISHLFSVFLLYYCQQSA